MLMTDKNLSIIETSIIFVLTFPDDRKNTGCFCSAR